MHESSAPSGAAMQRVGDACGDEAEILALSVARFVAAGYMTGDVACWDAAFNGAEALLGAVEGPSFVAKVVGIVRALRIERDGDWSFMPASCCRLTGHECALVALIGRGRRGRWDEVAQGAASLAGRETAPRLVAAIRAAAGTINSAATRLVPARPASAVLH
ncbi:hypothetical protein [Methylobacterium aerolatum]|uniref:Uncharacterized protein n=1 Tax=Methylobacterium aerolatum TaxID=418708 RepID=A0ABU0HZM6_9HYPH|nr:hypothetical protein [Methylobacterium aerolatum]MDQ0447803.1 hypothetical protein [Methylobacterium aerolatum]GJD34901.1 hypothetical protein FMGBMHLM_1808 [Methylobacterium aerolatum]